MAIFHSTLAEEYANNSAVKIFQQYIQINTTSGNDLSESPTDFKFVFPYLMFKYLLD